MRKLRSCLKTSFERRKSVAPLLSFIIRQTAVESRRWVQRLSRRLARSYLQRALSLLFSPALCSLIDALKAGAARVKRAHLRTCLFLAFYAASK